MDATLAAATRMHLLFVRMQFWYEMNTSFVRKIWRYHRTQPTKIVFNQKNKLLQNTPFSIILQFLIALYALQNIILLF